MALKFRLAAVLLFLACTSASYVHAEEASSEESSSSEGSSDRSQMDGYIGLAGGVASHRTAFEKGSRKTFQIEFGRNRTNASLSIRYGNGLGYTDGGVLFRMYQYWTPWKYLTISLGGGLGPMSSSGTGDDGTGRFATPTTHDGEVNRSFTDWLISSFTRLTFDTNSRFGITLDAGYEFVPYRKYFKNSSPQTDARPRGRTLVMLGLAFEVD